MERKLSAADKAPSGYQPFSTTHPEEEIHESRVKVKVNILFYYFKELQLLWFMVLKPFKDSISI